MERILKIGIFYDGHYFSRISSYYNYEHPERRHLSIKGLHDFVRHMVANKRNVDPEACFIADAHLFRGRLSALEARKIPDQLFKERYLEDMLIDNNVELHYRLNVEGREKGIDALFSLTAYKRSQEEKYDVVVLVTGDSDYVPVVQKIHGIGCRTMLLCWDFDSTNKNSGEPSTTRTSSALWREVEYPIAMHKLINTGLEEKNELVMGLFVQQHNEEGEFGPPPVPIVPAIKDKVDENGTKIVGKINVIKPDQGFVRYQNFQAVFYKNDKSLGIHFEDLKVGDRVEFSIRKEAKKKKEAYAIKLL